MDPSSLSFQHHEFLDVILQPFSFNLKSRTPCRRELRKEGQKRVCGGRIKASELDIKKCERESLALDSGSSYSLENYRLGWMSDLTNLERSVRESWKLNVKFSSMVQR